MRPYRIVLADDHMIVRQGLRRMIEEAADLAVVGEAGDGLELLRMVRDVAPNMVVLDIAMPNLRGIEATRELKRIRPDVKVLILTMYKDKELLHHAISAGADGYMLKEDSDTELILAIHKVRRGGFYASHLLSRALPDGWVEKSRKDRKAAFECLTTREREVLKLVAEGRSNKEIAALFYISVRTVENHRANIIKKLGLKRTADLVKYAIRRGYTQPSN
ncbi:MAG: response regulator transcription factor [Syntrophobacterales bacterium]|nr:MAG: response regulator transcription factor [Syntrophobacterales bacterium]